MFEGNYKMGKKWSGKGFDIKGNLIYQLNNGKGIIKEYSCVGNVIYEGEYLNGERYGKGKEYNFYKNLVYEGDYIKGKRNGIGKQFDPSGYLEFNGEYIDGKMNP